MEENDSSVMNINEMKAYSKQFVSEREWDKYHTPKNVAMGIAIESAELMEIFQWLDDQQSLDLKNDPTKKEQVADEMGDILHYLVRLATLLDIDLNQSFWNKIKKTEAKYPSALVKGKKDKYTVYSK